MMGKAQEGKFRLELRKAMSNLEGDPKLRLQTLAEKCATSYENVRKVVNKNAFPSENLLKKMCDVLELDYTQIKRMEIEDRARTKGWSHVIKDAAGIDPRIESFLTYLPHLSQADLEEMLMMFKMKAERNSGGGKKARKGVA